MHPALVRGVLFPLHERAFRRPTFPMLAELERSQWLSRGEIERLQGARLADLLANALRHTPWHAERIRAAGVDPSGGEVSLAALRRLPVMTRDDAREHGEGMVWRGVPGGAFAYNTGGSTGQPLTFHFGRMRQAADAAGRMRAQRWFGVEVGDPQVYLWGAPVELSRTDRIKTLRDRMVNHLLLNAFEMSAERVDEYVAAIRRFRPRALFGYASSIALLAGYARERGMDLRLPALRGVFTTGEPLYPHQREAIEAVFQVPVANEWGSRDVGFSAHEDPEGRMLAFSECIVFEVLDEQGDPVPPGTLGEAVVTGLASHAQPLIRYRTGDMLRMAPDQEAGGRGLHVLAEVAGRKTDFLVRADGTVMHALAVIYVLRALPGIAQFKLIQHAVDRVEVLVVPGGGWREEDAARVSAGLRARLGDDLAVDLRLMEAIPVERSGKFRYVVSHVPLPGVLRLAQEAGGG